MDLYPLPFSTLVSRLQREVGGHDIYALNKRGWWHPNPDFDLSYEHFGMRLGTPLGPASGPHTQLAQNLVLSWLGGSRFMELKTVQILDELEIPRPCIHIPHIGYNVEWSQELLVHQSALEYAKGWFLIHLLASDKGPGLWPGVETVFDISVGYDLAGIKTEKVANYLRSMKDASALIQQLRDELPPSLREWADVAVPSQISNSVTISTFHGCPADEIEAIATHLLEEYGFHTVIKLNPTLLGYERVCDIIQKRLGYDYIKLNEKPFEEDLKWAQMMDMLPRLQAVAAKKGVGFGVKFSNTLVMQSEEPPFVMGEDMYLSGPPLHVLAFTLAHKFREATNGDIPITFSAGVDATNFHELVAAGIGPITTCSDILKAKGYGRLPKYLQGLEKEMKKYGVTNVEAFRAAVGGAENAKAGADVTIAALAAGVIDDPRYSKEKNQKAPKKVGTALVLFDCLTCDKCIPVCPNAANFAFPVPKGEVSPGKVTFAGGAWKMSEGETLIIDRKHQIGNTVEACNLCGHCDTWCPEDGGPYLTKPNLFVLASAFADHPERDGFLVDPDFKGITWRREGKLYHFAVEAGDKACLALPDGGKVWLDGDTPTAVEGSGTIDLTIAASMRVILAGVTDPTAATWLPAAELYADEYEANSTNS